MITQEEFHEIFKAMVTYASDPQKPEYVVAPSPQSQQQGTKPLDTLPAQWWNWFLKEATTRFNAERNLVGNVVAEVENLLSMFGLQADKDSVTQLKDMFEKEYPEKILGEVKPLLDELKQEVDENITPKIESVSAKVEDIEVKIPEQASAENQLADKDFVNSSVSTNTANYIGNFDSLDALKAYSGTLTNNDYAFVTSVDSAGNRLYNRYKYNAGSGEWMFEYSLNNSSFTSEQWAAINSSVTSAEVSQIDTNKSDIATLTEKTEKLSANATAIYYAGTKYNTMKVTNSNGLLTFTFE